MDKNLAAFLREDAYTIKVKFQKDSQDQYHDNEYTYVTNIPGIASGDFVVVPYKSRNTNAVRLSVAIVSDVHNDVDIEPNSDIQYAWVTSRIDMQASIKLAEENETITKQLAKAYRTNARRSFAQSVLEAADNDTKLLISGILHKS